VKAIREMSSREIGEHLGFLIRSERKITNEILAAINLAQERRAYLELGYPSMFEWLVKGFGYSGSAAFRRLEAARMLGAVPEISKKLEAGSVNLSTVSKAQSVIKAHEKIEGRRLSEKQKAEVIEKIEGQSYQETEQTLLNLFPEAASSVHQERRVVISDRIVRHSMNLPKEAEGNLRRAKEVLSHKFPNGSDAEIVAYALEFLLDKLDPLKKMTRSASESVPVRGKTAARREIIQAADARCTFKDDRGRICNSRYQVQIDHIIPRALGGTDDPSNLRMRCRQHNLLEAERVFGREKIDKFRRH